MTEVYLKKVDLDTLFDLMIQTFKELLQAGKNEKLVKIKKKELSLLQRVIVAKVQELYPVDQLLHSIFTN
ncbi:MAG: hypothetical protein ABI675_05615 [Chitinophagaceae bacterium]